MCSNMHAEALEELFGVTDVEQSSDDNHAIYYEGITQDGVEVELKVVHDGDADGDTYGRPALSEDWQALGNIRDY